MQTLARPRNRPALPTLTSRQTAAPTPGTTVARTGVPVRSETLPSCFEKGSTWSRAIEKIIRAAAVWIARVQTDTASATSSSSSLPTVVPSWLVST
jgi:hypothetical protein